MHRTFSLLTLFVASAIIGGCNLGPQVSGSGEVITESRQLPPFSGIDIDGAIDVSVVYGSTQSVKVIAEDNIVPIISTRVEDDIIHVTSEKPYSANERVRLEIVIPVVRSVEIAGSSKVDVHGQSIEVNPIDEFRLLIEGSGRVTVEKMMASSVEVEIEGSGDVELGGSGENLKLTIEGSGEIDATRFVGRSGDVSIEGAGDIRLNVTDRLRGSISGSGNILYSGSPASVEKEISGSGKIRPM